METAWSAAPGLDRHGMARRRLTGAVLASLAAGCAQVPVQRAAAPFVPPVFPQPPDEPRFVYERTIYGSADVVVPESGSDLKQLVTGEGQKSEGLSKPYAVAVHRGRVYVSDSAQRYIRVFDFPAGRFYKIGQEEPGRIVKPLGIDGPNCHIDGAILDKNVRIGEGVVIKPFPPGTDMDGSNWVVQDGIVVIPKDALIHPGTYIGPD